MRKSPLLYKQFVIGGEKKIENEKMRQENVTKTAKHPTRKKNW